MNRHALILAGLVAAGAALTAAADEAPAAATRVTAQADGEATPRPPGRATASTPPRATPSRAQSALERRIALLARELDLDSAQQLRVRDLLEGQREQVLRLWNDESLPSAIRIKQTQSISAQTQDGIRALLTDAQKQKYSKPRPAGVSAPAASPDLESWMDQVNGR